MGGWKYDRRKKSTQVYEQVMGVVMAVVLVAVVVQWVIGAVK